MWFVHILSSSHEHLSLLGFQGGDGYIYISQYITMLASQALYKIYGFLVGNWETAHLKTDPVVGSGVSGMYE